MVKNDMNSTSKAHTNLAKYLLLDDSVVAARKCLAECGKLTNEMMIDEEVQRKVSHVLEPAGQRTMHIVTAEPPSGERNYSQASISTKPVIEGRKIETVGDCMPYPSPTSSFGTTYCI